MSDEKSTGLDVLGIKPIAEAINKVTAGAVDGAAAILSRICLPAAEEIGKYWCDRMAQRRLLNFIDFTKRLDKKMSEYKMPEGLHAHPRLVYQIVEQASFVDDSVVQDMWAGLLASACTLTGDDDSNLLFTDLLSRMTKLQARMLDYACKNAQKEFMATGLVVASYLQVSLDELRRIADETDVSRLDRELDSLTSMGLIDSRRGGFDQHSIRYAGLTPTALALHMYVRCQGSRESPADYFAKVSPNMPQQVTPA